MYFASFVCFSHSLAADSTGVFAAQRVVVTNGVLPHSLHTISLFPVMV